MSVCHILLGRPWQFDRSAIHNGRANTYQLNWHGKNILLRPMTPQQIVQESHHKTEIDKESKRDEMRANENNVGDSINPNESEKNKGVSLLAMIATKERDFREDHKGGILVSNHITPLSFSVANVFQEIDGVCMDEVPPDLHSKGGIECPLGAIQETTSTTRAHYKDKLHEATNTIQHQVNLFHKDEVGASRTMPFQGGEDDEDIPSFTTHSPLLNHKVNSFLLNGAVYDYKNCILPKTMNDYILRFINNTNVMGDHQNMEHQDMKSKGDYLKTHGDNKIEHAAIIKTKLSKCLREEREAGAHGERHVGGAPHNVDAPD